MFTSDELLWLDAALGALLDGMMNAEDIADVEVLRAKVNSLR